MEVYSLRIKLPIIKDLQKIPQMKNPDGSIRTFLQEFYLIPPLLQDPLK
jgi:hypothetical protein